MRTEFGEPGVEIGNQVAGQLVFDRAVVGRIGRGRPAVVVFDHV